MVLTFHVLRVRSAGPWACGALAGSWEERPAHRAVRRGGRAVTGRRGPSQVLRARPERGFPSVSCHPLGQRWTHSQAVPTSADGTASLSAPGGCPPWAGTGPPGFQSHPVYFSESKKLVSGMSTGRLPSGAGPSSAGAGVSPPTTGERGPLPTGLPMPPVTRPPLARSSLASPAEPPAARCSLRVSLRPAPAPCRAHGAGAGRPHPRTGQHPQSAASSEPSVLLAPVQPALGFCSVCGRCRLSACTGLRASPCPCPLTRAAGPCSCR